MADGPAPRHGAGRETVRMVQAAAPGVGASTGLVLSKHEGAGNDFLVLVDPAPVTVALVRALCDRRRGVGADGLIVVAPGTGADLSMVLFNADGSPAEMSGNGIRCLVQAAVAAGLAAPGRVTVSTAAGLRSVDYEDRASDGRGWASVDMGTVTLGPEEEPPLTGTRARRASAGNPHLVVVGDPGLDLDALDLTALAAHVAPGFEDGVNVEVVRPGIGPGTLELRVFERGAGETLACGTGSCAAAAVARAYGLVGDEVAVQNPGGTLHVRLGDPVVLGGPVRHVADVTVDPRTLGP